VENLLLLSKVLMLVSVALAQLKAGLGLLDELDTVANFSVLVQLASERGSKTTEDGKAMRKASGAGPDEKLDEASSLSRSRSISLDWTKSKGDLIRIMLDRKGSSADDVLCEALLIMMNKFLSGSFPLPMSCPPNLGRINAVWEILYVALDKMLKHAYHPPTIRLVLEESLKIYQSLQAIRGKTAGFETHMPKIDAMQSNLLTMVSKIIMNDLVNPRSSMGEDLAIFEDFLAKLQKMGLSGDEEKEIIYFVCKFLFLNLTPSKISREQLTSCPPFVIPNVLRV
jgi:hypothetical protein